MRNLDLALVRAFVTVAEQRSMTVAAASLNLTQGAVSQQIARLEAIAGTALLTRDRSGIRLKPAGERLFGKAKQMLALNDDILRGLGDDIMRGLVRIGVPYDLMASGVASVLKSYCDAYPGVEVSLIGGSSVELAAGVREGRIDLAIVEQPTDVATGECLSIERLVWAGAKGGRAHGQTPLPVSMVAETCAFRPAVFAALERNSIDWRTVFENGGLDATLAMVRSDLAVSVWLASTLPADLDIVPPEAGMPDLPSFAISIHLPERTPAPAVDELARQIRRAFQRARS